MAHLLSRLGLYSARHAKAVLTGWIVALLAMGGLFLAFGGALANSFSIPGTRTADVTAQLAEEMPGLGGVSATVVFSSDDGPFTTEQTEDIAGLLAEISQVDRVANVVDPFISAAAMIEQQATIDGAIDQLIAADMYDPDSDDLMSINPELAIGQQMLQYSSKIATVSEDGVTALGMVMFTDDIFSLPETSKSSVIDLLDSAQIPGVSISYSSELAQSVDGLIGIGEVVGVVIAGIVLFLMLGTALATALPLVASLIGVGVGVTGAMALSGVVDMTSVTPILGVMLGLAVGIDYSLFIMNRHRKQLLNGMDVHPSIGLANGTSGNAVLFAGATVVVALLALNVSGIPFLSLMGTVGAICVVVAVGVALTATPALLALAGHRILPKKHRNVHQDKKPDATRSLTAPSRTRSAITLVAATAVLLAVAIPALSMRLGLPDGAQEPEGSQANQTYRTIAEKFGPGFNGPLLVVTNLSEPADEQTQGLIQAQTAQHLMSHPDIVAVAPVGVGKNHDMMAFQVIPAGGPTSESTENLVHDLREMKSTSAVASFDVAGSASGNIDISERLSDAMPTYLMLVIGLSILILLLVFRSIVVPIVATIGFVLSYFAAMGAVVAVYQWGWLSDIFGVHAPGPILNFLPIILLGVLFGLAMDYQLFIGSGIREAYAHGLSSRLAVVSGVRAGRSVVTAAAIIMFSVFGGFVFSHLTMVRPIGFALAFGVLIDAFVIRMLVIPAVLNIVGDRAWWLPRWLDRALPSVDVEGASLERHADQPTAQ